MSKLFITLAFATAIGLSITAVGACAHTEHGQGKQATEVKKVQKPWGIAASPKAVQRTIEINMTDAMRFEPDRIMVRQGEAVRLRVRNNGKMLHELVIGTRQELEAHAAMMLRHPDMAHDEPYMVHVPAGKTGEILWSFNRAGEFDFACLIAGHFQAGMVGKITVSKR